MTLYDFSAINEHVQAEAVWHKRVITTKGATANKTLPFTFTYLIQVAS